MSLIKNYLTVGIVLFHNSREEVFRCLDAIAHQENLPFSVEVLIRDQGEGSLQWVSDWEESHPDVISILKLQGENLGFGEGHNSLFKQRHQNSIAYLCLNPDAQLHPLALANLCTFASKCEWRGLFEPMHEPIMPPKYYDPASGETEWCSGACLLIPVLIYEKLNGFDPAFFMYCEDVDFSWRARALGFKCYVCIGALVFHYVEDRSNRDLMAAKSQYVLAYKWGTTYDRDRAKERLIALRMQEQGDLESISEYITMIDSDSIAKVKPNFNNGDIYAKDLWI